MAAPVFFRKDLRVLRPEGEAAESIMSKIKLGDIVTVEVRKPRCLSHHRLYWALCQIVAANMEGDYDAEVVSDVIKVRAGHVTPVKTARGELFLPKSISFSNMDQVAFRDFFDRALRVVVTDIIPGLNSDVLRAEVEAIVGEK
jgi:hypothetical protein